MITREHYLNPIRSFYNSDLIKIITGIRRSGKSVLLKQAYAEIGTQGKDTLFLDFDFKPVRNQILDADALIEYIKDNRGGGTCYKGLDYM